MALHRGIQSAIFYYLSCAPCADARYRKKRKAEAKRHRAAHNALAEEFPDFYRQPCPSTTNPWWQSEIDAGPSINTRRKRNGVAATSDVGWRGSRPSGDTSRATSSVTLAPGADPTTGGSQSKFAHFQREDEPLWGSKAIWDNDPIRRPTPARTREPATSQYQNYHNPSVNDMHPPIAPTARSRADVLWMMQPPPIAEVMNGKEHPSKSSNSKASSLLAPNSQPMSRQTSDNPSERGLSATDRATTDLSRGNSGRSSNASAGQRHDRNSTTSERDFATEPIDRQRRPRVDTTQESEDSNLTTIYRPTFPAELHNVIPNPRAALRPQLSTIMSDSIVRREAYHQAAAGEEEAQKPRHGDKENSSPAPRGNDADFELGHARRPYHAPMSPAQRSPLLVNEQSLKIVQDLTPGSAAIFNTKLFTTDSPIKEGSVIRIPVANGENINSGSGDDAPEVFDGWFTPDVDLSKWIHEHTKREVRQRWSMDL